MRTSRMVWFGLLLQYFLMVQEQAGADFATRTASPLGRHFATRAARTALNRLLGGRA